MVPPKSLANVAPLFLVLFIDGMGLGLLVPIINSVIIQKSADFLPVMTPLSEREFLYGLVLGIYMICWFLGAAMMGDLSDVSGRKKSLLLCLIGAVIGYFLSGIAVTCSSIIWLIVGRVIAGFTAGSQPIAQAAIVDVSTEENKARNIGLILFAISLGFVVGPLIGGVLSDSTIVSWFNYSTPLYFAALFSLVNAVLLQCLFQETFIKTGDIKIQFSRAFVIFAQAFKHDKIRSLSLVMLVMIFGWANYYSFISMYLYEHYHYDTLEVGLFMATLGVGFGIGSGFFVDFLSRRYAAKTLVMIGSFVTGLFVVLTILLPTAWLSWCFAVVIGAAINVAYSLIISLFSNQVGENEQGWVMGVTGSIMALCFGITCFLTGIFVEAGPCVPLILSAAGLILAAILMAWINPSKAQSQ